MCFRDVKCKTIVMKARIYKFVNTTKSIIFRKKFDEILMTSTIIM